VLQPEPGQLAYYPIIDAIQEFKIESNSPAAEFGRFNGGVVNLTTKSGTNAYHGNVFEFFRNEHLNARNYFQSSNPVKPDYRRNQYGGMSGGPIVKDRTFFFVDYQGQRQSIGRTVTSNVPTLAERSGVFRQNIYDPATTVGIRVSSFRTTRFREAPWIPSRCRFSSATRSDQHRHREQLQPDGQRNRQSGSGRLCASITSLRQAVIRRSDG
jgi:hypothetical protein